MVEEGDWRGRVEEREEAAGRVVGESEGEGEADDGGSSVTLDGWIVAVRIGGCCCDDTPPPLRVDVDDRSRSCLTLSCCSLVAVMADRWAVTCGSTWWGEVERLCG